MIYYKKRRKWKWITHVKKRFVLQGLDFQGVTHEGPFLKISNNVLTIAKGYAWDGASSIMPDITSVMSASLYHDALYQLMREGVLPQTARKRIDQIFREVCIASGMNRPLAWTAYRAVRLGAKKSGQPNLLSAP